MTIILTLLGIHLLNVVFILVNMMRLAATTDLPHGSNVRFFLWLLRHPILDGITVLALLIHSEEQITTIAKNVMKNDSK